MIEGVVKAAPTTIKNHSEWPMRLLGWTPLLTVEDILADEVILGLDQKLQWFVRQTGVGSACVSLRFLGITSRGCALTSTPFLR